MFYFIINLLYISFIEEVMGIMLVFLFVVIFLSAGILLLLSGLFPIKIEISYFAGEPVATMHKRSIIPPFKEKVITVPNLKRAIMATKRSSDGMLAYRVELESFDGTIIPVTNAYTSVYKSRQQLLIKINESIKENLPFEYIVTQYTNIVMGFVFIAVSIFIFVLAY